MYLHITPIEDIATEIERMEEHLDREITDDINLCAEQLKELGHYHSRAGKIVSDAKYYLNEATQNSILKEAGTNAGLSTSTVNKLIKANCKNEQLIFDRADKVYKNIEKQIDILRTLISKAKMEMNIQH